MFVAFSLIIGLIVYCNAHAVPVIRPYITTFNTNGSITGTILPGYRTPFIEGFLGIPFAEPPVGDLRFRDPRPFPNFWSHDHIANQEHEMCIQKNFAHPSGVFLVEGTEDCLYLNIFRPIGIPSDRLLPVFINIHGGGFTAGRPTSPMYGPKFFMDHGDVILVAPSYRLGPIGFLSTGDDEMPGNFAFKDQVVAMQWIKENIIFFNGDPNQITLYGQSAGGVSVHMHMLSRLSNGLFNRVISASGTAVAAFFYVNQDPLAQTRQLAKAVGIENYDNLTTAELAAQLRSTEPSDILDAGESFLLWSIDPFIVFTPVVENPNSPTAFLVEDPRDSLANGNFKDLPLLMAIVPEEGVIRAGPILTNERELESLNENFDLVVGLHTFLSQDDPELQTKIDKIVNFYFNGTRHLDWDNAQRMIDMLGDRNFDYPLYSSYKFHSKHVNPNVNPLYLIEFNYRGPFSYSYLTTQTQIDFGVVHADDLLYLFDTLMFPLFDFDSVDAKLVTEMVNIYMNFANGRAPHEKSTVCTFDEADPDKPCDYLYVVNSDNEIGYEIQSSNALDMDMVNFWRGIDRLF